MEKKLEVHPEMRFLDLEHEIDHIIQFEKNLEGNFGTEVFRELSPNRKKLVTNMNMGYTNNVQKAFLEFEERIRELARLENRGAPQSIIDEHVEGVRFHKDFYQNAKSNMKSSNRRKFTLWKEKYFPNFNEIINP